MTEQQSWRKVIVVWITLLAGSFIINSVAVFCGFNCSLWLMERFYQIRGVNPPANNVVLVSIDDKSFLRLGLSRKKPVPIETVRQAIDQIASYSPGAIFVDHDLLSKESTRSLIDSYGTLLTPYKEEIVNYPELTAVDAGDSTTFTLYRSGDFVFWLAPRGQPSSLNAAAKALNLELATQKKSTGQYINFYGPAGTLPSISLHKLLQADSEFAPDLKDKLVFLGVQSHTLLRGQVDSSLHRVPVAKSRMFSVEVHATSVANLIDRAWIRDMSISVSLGIIFCLALITTLILLASKFASLNIFVLGCLTVSACYFSFSYFLFWNRYFPVMVLIPVLGLILRGLLDTPVVSRELDRLKEMFALE